MYYSISIHQGCVKIQEGKNKIMSNLNIFVIKPRFANLPLRAIIAPVFVFNLRRKGAIQLPLIICTMFFILLFSCEMIWFEILTTRREREMRRYQRIEHPRRATGDNYIDLFS